MFQKPAVLTEEQYELKKQAELYKQLVDQKSGDATAGVIRLLHYWLSSYHSTLKLVNKRISYFSKNDYVVVLSGKAL